MQQVKISTSINLVIFGLICLIVGRLWGVVLPLNKGLWTSSYVVYTAGWALLLVLALCYEIVDRSTEVKMARFTLGSHGFKCHFPICWFWFVFSSLD